MEKMVKFLNTLRLITACLFLLHRLFFPEKNQHQRKKKWPDGKNSDWKRACPHAKKEEEWFSTKSQTTGYLVTVWEALKKLQTSINGSCQLNQSILILELTHTHLPNKKKTPKKKSKILLHSKIKLTQFQWPKWRNIVRRNKYCLWQNQMKISWNKEMIWKEVILEKENTSRSWKVWHLLKNQLPRWVNLTKSRRTNLKQQNLKKFWKRSLLQL